MFTPRAFAETDLAGLDALIARDAFVTLVTHRDGETQASHLPVLYARKGEAIDIRGHWARANPQATHAGPALLIVHGPHAYVSPSWYPGAERAERVPTWNYAAAHLYGELVPTGDEAELVAIVTGLGTLNEAHVDGDWHYQSERASHHGLLRGIVGFRFVPARVELKFKLSQNHPPGNVIGAADALAQRADDNSRQVAALMRDRLSRRDT